MIKMEIFYNENGVNKNERQREKQSNGYAGLSVPNILNKQKVVLMKYIYNMSSCRVLFKCRRLQTLAAKEKKKSKIVTIHHLKTPPEKKKTRFFREVFLFNKTSFLGSFNGTNNKRGE